MANVFRGHCSLSMSVFIPTNLHLVGSFGLRSPVFRVTRNRVRMISTGSSDTCSRGVWTRSSVLHLFFNDVYKVDLPPGHRFPMEKYRLVREGLQRELRNDAEAGPVLRPQGAFHVSPLASLEDLRTTHDRGYVERYLQGRFTDMENRVVGFPWSEASVKRSLSSVGGTIGAMHAVCGGSPVEDGGEIGTRGSQPLFAGHIAGGTHHAFWDRGEGFCVFSDIAVAANVALRDYPETIRQIMIVDLDVHQGNGNARLFADKPSVFTFSVHCRENYFSKIEKSDVDVEVGEGAGDDEYLGLLYKRLPPLVDEVGPDLIFYQGGIDPIQNDRLGKLKLTREGLRRRNRFVYETALRRGTPTVVTMGGGYPKDLSTSSEGFRQIVRSHQDVYLDAAEVLLSTKSTKGGLETLERSEGAGR